MKSVILAAGKGERLDPLTQTRPKAFMPILNSSVIERIISFLTDLGIKDILVLIAKDTPSEYNEFISKLSRYSNIKIVIQDSRFYGTASALMSVEKEINDNTFLLVYGDLLIEKKAIENILDSRYNSILGVESNTPKDYGVLSIRDEIFLDKIIEKPQNPPSNLINGGIYKLSRDIFHYIEKINKSIRGEYELPDAINLMAAESKIEVVRYNGLWMDIGRPWDIIDANKKILDKEQEKNNGDIEDGVKIKGKVIIENNVKILHGTYIEGPVYIGPNSVIGPNSYIRPYSIICGNNRIGASVEIKESVIMENTKVPHLSYVGDSILAEDVNLGAGTLIANLRFDEHEVKVNIKGEKVSTKRKKFGAIIGGHVRTGINVTILPGVKIGAYARIYPGAIVNRDVGKGEFFKT
ncbi:NTP transferase domain-containing protein [Acidianus sulfidivorans JP7]|uniref:Nucleotidyltransferase n=1 Tax=Acidianus sulfidivorans JP7 TaxID=619593 RepID=A0A2U9IMV2_9CREN|nr:bifunctional sugar-1-phosphate nucleotidylyltransferase/acetyltransferase [Acidianus sulfidivorans]AWR97264.1 NTP transferase domain-containing protein [Acidianus sulfidivorans JP7]